MLVFQCPPNPPVHSDIPFFPDPTEMTWLLHCLSNAFLGLRSSGNLISVHINVFHLPRILLSVYLMKPNTILDVTIFSKSKMILKDLVKNQSCWIHNSFWPRVVEISICQLKYYHLEVTRVYISLCPVSFKIMQFKINVLIRWDIISYCIKFKTTYPSTLKILENRNHDPYPRVSSSIT